ncbi:hypothetical protein FJU08_06190 [Martelella alba]|uniref:Acylphosphatase n=1 Tax=Martelella alba TaxID=2590451 RepID=A0A506UG10_9HYPH|nr:hypothetical protein [Martelella alba]TPW32576.1 hypothetical protein FJU08_06190 [Martelella alba]
MTDNATKTTFRFSGRLSPQSFRALAENRAARLALQIDILTLDERAAEIRVHGPEALIGAFEMALSLGPYDCMILDIATSPA